MSVLKRAFQLLEDFSKLKPIERRKRIAKLDQLLSSIEEKEGKARLTIRELDQLRKQRAYLLIKSGRVEQGTTVIKALVADMEQSIADLHDEAGFQLAEAALASFRNGRLSAGHDFARSALRHSGLAKKVNRTLLSALEVMQQQQELESRRHHDQASPGNL